MSNHDRDVFPVVLSVLAVVLLVMLGAPVAPTALAVGTVDTVGSDGQRIVRDTGGPPGGVPHVDAAPLGTPVSPSVRQLATATTAGDWRALQERRPGAQAQPVAAALSSSSPRTTLTWRPCPARGDDHKVVATYSRRRLSAGPAYLPGGPSTLDCGASKYGYRHIVEGHLLEWEQMALITRQNWRQVADFALGWTLRDPDSGSYRSSNDTFCFERLVYLVDQKTRRPAGTRDVVVVIARRSKNVITAYPGGC